MGENIFKWCDRQGIFSKYTNRSAAQLKKIFVNKQIWINRHLSKENIQMAKKHMKRCIISLIIKNN